MRSRVVRAGLLLWALCALWPAAAAAQPASGPREVLDQAFTATHANRPTGVRFTGAYHAAGNKKGNPPYLKRMIFYPPPGLRYDTSVPARCTAPDVVLQVQGPAACPAASRLGGGTTEGVFYEPVASAFVIDRYKHTLDVMNNANEQIILVKAEGYAVARGRIRPDGSQEFRNQTCFPKPPTGCTSDYVLQTMSAARLARYTRAVNGRVRSYATTPPKCPASGYWRTTVKLWWKGGAVDSVVTKQPCRTG
jgi:hypothetical protein